ncbi:MAG: hypothetical protein M1814_001291 [Vezdaea aestivalis]|nr:MAG: hypothetical protein M1814_001291 [Vezdaea aestivalis]
MADRIKAFLASSNSRSDSLSSDRQRALPSIPASEKGHDTPEQGSSQALPPKSFPKGVVLGADGKPCRSCTSFASWAASTSSSDKSRLPKTALEPPPDCPADVETLGRSTWTFLHTLAANYPSKPTETRQLSTIQFIRLFGDMYPCAPCAQDFREWMTEEGNSPRVRSRDELGRWMCEAHNAVNEKLGKGRFNCDDWEKKWRHGEWGDGRCG